MTLINKISDTPPVFPCWLYSLYHWTRFSRKPIFWESYTHWSPDAPTAPTFTPSPTPQDVAAGTEDERKRLADEEDDKETNGFPPTSFP